LKLGRTTSLSQQRTSEKCKKTLGYDLGFSPDRILASAADAITKLALVTSTDLGEAAQTMAGTLNGFNLEATESGRVANVMAESFAKSALNMEKFTVGTANSSAIARVFGATVEENTARLGKLVDSQISMPAKQVRILRRIYIRP
jgi:TP901 family phage tail tape measure protein